MANKNRTRTQPDDQSVASDPMNYVRRFDVWRVGVDLLINLLEANLDRLRHDAGWDVTGTQHLPKLLREKVLEFVKEHGSTMAAFETVVKMTVQAALPGTTARESAGAIIDFYVDELRAAANETSDRRAEARVSQAVGNMKARIDQTIRDAKAEKEKKSSYDQLYSKLDDHERISIHDVTSWMLENAPTDFETWLVFRDKINSIEILKDLIWRVEKTKGDEAKGKVLIQYLRSHYAEKKEPEKKPEEKGIPPFLRIAWDAVHGDKKSEHVKKFSDGIAHFRADAKKQTEKWEKDIARRKKNEMPEMPFGWYAGLCLIALGFVLWYFLGSWGWAIAFSAIGLVFIAVWVLVIHDRLKRPEAPEEDEPEEDSPPTADNAAAGI